MRTRSQDASFVPRCVRNQDTGERNSAPSTVNKPTSTERAGCVPVYLHTDTDTDTDTRTHTLVSWRSAYRRCLLSTTSHRCVPAGLLGRALPQRLPALPPVDRRPWTCICTHTQANWWSACRHCLLRTNLPGCVPAHIPELTCSTPLTLPLSTPPWTYTSMN